MNEACEKQWGGWLYGGGFVKVAKDEVPEVLNEIIRKKQEIEQEGDEIKKKSERLKTRAKGAMMRGRAMASARGIVMPSFDGLTPEEMREVSDAMRKKAEFERNPMVQRIRETIKEKTIGKAGLICPECGEPDQHNLMNGKPWCMKCNARLVEPDQIGTWVKIKQGNSDALMRKMRGLPDEGVTK